MGHTWPTSHILESCPCAECCNWRIEKQDRDRIGQLLAALGAIRQDVAYLKGAVMRLEGIVAPVGCESGCNCHAKDWGDESRPE